MPRTPLFASLSRALRIAAYSARARPGTPPIDELLDMAYTRRRFLRDSAVAASALATGAWTYGFHSHAANPPQGVRIAVVGAGLAGLNTAYKLQKVGLRAKVFEGSDRIG
jgi:monoamine oxidase